MAEPAQFAMATNRRDAIRSQLPNPPPLSSSSSSSCCLSPVSSPRIQTMMQRRSEFASQLEFEIEASKDHWSELESKRTLPQASSHLDEKSSSKTRLQFQIFTRFRRTLSRLLFCYHCYHSCPSCGCAFSCGVFTSEHNQQSNQLECVELEEGEEPDTEELSNREIFNTMVKSHYGITNFFSPNLGNKLELGPKIAEGGQAEIYDVESGIDSIRMDFVVKVFKKGYSLRHLQSQWPLNSTPLLVNSAIIVAGTVLKDDRFAFVMYKYWGDLRKLIDLKKMDQSHHSNYHSPPFSHQQSISIMLQIANGMLQLHKKNIVHRDLKASNVLIACDVFKRNNPLDPCHRDTEFTCAIADYECSAGVLGTGFWRAPEILVAVRDRQSCDLEEVFTSKADVYSFAMTCYEILTGCVPFEEVGAGDPEAVVKGTRPVLPHPMNSRVTELLCRCWHSNADERPDFAEIVGVLEIAKRQNSELTNSHSFSRHKQPSVQAIVPSDGHHQTLHPHS